MKASLAIFVLFAVIGIAMGDMDIASKPPASHNISACQKRACE